jgi:hypothetical protein
MIIYEAFVYEWTNIKNNMKYIGSHKGKEDDGYISSSKHMLKDYHDDPSTFDRKIIAYGEVDEMRELESKLLQQVDAAKNPFYYNMHNQNGKFICNGHNEDTKDRMKKRTPWNKGKKNIYSEETLEKMRKAKEDYVPWNVGITRSEETKKKLSEHRSSKHHAYGKKTEHSEKMKVIWQKRKLKND